MTKNPFINAVVASAYIMLVGTIMNYGSRWFGGPDTFFTPMAALSLFVLSAAVMGYLFLYQPILLLLAGNKKEGLKLFLQTLAVFALITVLLFGSLFLRV